MKKQTKDAMQAFIEAIEQANGKRPEGAKTAAEIGRELGVDRFRARTICGTCVRSGTFEAIPGKLNGRATTYYRPI